MIATIEEVKKFWNDRPCNVRHSSKEVGTEEYFNEVERKKFFVEPHILGFTNFEQWNGKKVLEIGCGLATAGINFALSGSDYTGVELSEESLSLAKKRFEVFGQTGTFYSGNAEQLSSFVPVETYDLIYSFGVIHHSPHPEKIISEIKKYMNENSVLKIMLYAKNSWKNYMIDAGLDQPEAQYGCPIANTYTKEDVVELLDGYEVLSIEQDHIFPYQVEPYKRGEYIKQPWFDAMPPEMFRSLEKNLGWHLLITAKLK
jgi:2-polyprenyl-3-methyl-5-hydroxy-6-metoxy-1,4-benzoquinol methylase